ncbi:hypothetical protein FGO68_gene1376 [Halteria grandinella]|uniref:Uncharacterized protein n=1 Tax=Halteria grandinella TaxID=5974 RepID=A0A8J8NV55_HALGN|nr:hypothetical protein FGO68_gene1376 [Halteria grandinella]
MELCQSTNNLIQEKQELCACKRGNKVRYNCPQETCAIHRENIFLCDDCFNDIIEGEEPHKLLQIQKLLEPLTKKWHALIQKEEETYTQILRYQNQFKQAIELLEADINNPSRYISKEISDYEKFRTLFKQTTTVFKEYQQNQQFTKIHGLNGKYDQYCKLIDSGFPIIKEIGETDFVYQNYTQCIENCKIPEKPDEKSTRDAILAMKARSWNSQIQKASTQVAEDISQEKLIEEVKQLKQTVKLQQTQINALLSILGGLEGASQLVSKSFDSLQFQKKEEQSSLKIMPLELKLSQTLQEVKPFPKQQTIQLAEPIFRAKPLSGFKPFEGLSLAPQPQPLFGVSKPNILTSPAIPGNPFSAQILFGAAKKTEEKKMEYEIVQQFPLKPVPHVFTQDMLDKLLGAFNKPFSNYTPKLDEHRQSKLADFMTKHGWFKSLEELNADYYNSLPKKTKSINQQLLNAQISHCQ